MLLTLLVALHSTLSSESIGRVWNNRIFEFCGLVLKQNCETVLLQLEVDEVFDLIGVNNEFTGLSRSANLRLCAWKIISYILKRNLKKKNSFA